MIYDLLKLKSGIEKEIIVEEVYSFSKEWLEKTELLRLDEVKIKGKIFMNTLNEVELFLSIQGTMVLPCSITLKPVLHPFSTEVQGTVKEILEEMEEKNKKFENSLDILPIIWENILMEIPMKVTSPDASNVKLEGEGWKFVTDEEIKECSPALEKLKDLL